MLWLKVVLEGYRRCPDSHDPCECLYLSDMAAGIYINSTSGCQKDSSSYKFNSLNFDSRKISSTTLQGHISSGNVGVQAHNEHVVSQLP